MATVREIFSFIDQWAPFETQMSFDNAGFLVGRGERTVNKVLVALDITEEVVVEAVRLGVQLIVAHHPVIFHPVKQITDDSVEGRKLLALTEQGIAAICAHTNLDAAAGGVNEELARVLGLSNVRQLHQDGIDAYGRPYGIGRVGEVEKCSLEEFAKRVKATLEVAGVRFYDASHPVCHVAVGGGSCGSMLSDVLAQGCDTFVTADVKYDVFLEAKALGINLIDAGHFSTEQVVCPVLKKQIERAFPNLEVYLSQCQKEAFSCC